MKKNIMLTVIIIFNTGWLFCSSGREDNKHQNNISEMVEKKNKSVIAESTNSKPIITFIELGSVKCIPCQMMQPVMKTIEKKYGEQIEVIFYDVWKPEEKHYAQKYNIRLIPTQVFLDSTEQEIFRHEGFFPEVELDKFLQAAGLVIQPH